MTLANGTAFPSTQAVNREGEAVDIGDLTADSWAVVLFYRGHW
jgi:peroxiredoxin